MQVAVDGRDQGVTRIVTRDVRAHHEAPSLRKNESTTAGGSGPAWPVVREASSFGAAFLALIGLGIVYFGRDALVLMADRKFWPAADLLPPLVLAAVLQVLTYPLQTGFLYHKATRHVFHVGAGYFHGGLQWGGKS